MTPDPRGTRMRLTEPELQLTITPALLVVAALFDTFLMVFAVAAVRRLRSAPVQAPRSR
jgi:hypothetical protein